MGEPTKLNLRPNERGRLTVKSNVGLDESTIEWTSNGQVVIDKDRSNSAFDVLAVAVAVGVGMVEFRALDSEGRNREHVFEITVSEENLDDALIGNARVSRESIPATVPDVETVPIVDGSELSSEPAPAEEAPAEVATESTEPLPDALPTEAVVADTPSEEVAPEAPAEAIPAEVSVPLTDPTDPGLMSGHQIDAAVNAEIIAETVASAESPADTTAEALAEITAADAEVAAEEALGETSEALPVDDAPEGTVELPLVDEVPAETLPEIVGDDTKVPEQEAPLGDPSPFVEPAPEETKPEDEEPSSGNPFGNHPTI